MQNHALLDQHRMDDQRHQERASFLRAIKETMMFGRGGKLEWESDKYMTWRENAWTDLQRQSKFVRRAIHGAFNAHSYTYFRPEVNYEGTVFLNPLAILLAVKKDYRRTSALYIAGTIK